ncbi:diguanylate cyclase, partial [Yersinia kristensenii]
MTHPIVLSDGQEITTSLSIGVAIYPDHAQTPDELLQRADEAMYQAKKGFRLYEQSIVYLSDFLYSENKHPEITHTENLG